jgi:hypothetical protein
MVRRSLIALSIAVLLMPGAARAHHSGSEFDRTRPIIVTGVVKKFLWANPHGWLYLDVPNGKGGTDEWALEGGSVVVMIRNGWTAKSLLPGQTVRVLVAPRRDGRNGGEFLSVTFEDGKVLSFGIV